MSPPNGVKILCVEDDPDSCEMLETFLVELSGGEFDVVGVNSAEEAKQRISREDFDLFVLDHWLRDWDGVELCRWIRDREPGKPIMFFPRPLSPPTSGERSKRGPQRTWSSRTTLGGCRRW